MRQGMYSLKRSQEAVEKVPKPCSPSHSRKGRILFLRELWKPVSAGMTWLRAFSTVSRDLLFLEPTHSWVFEIIQEHSCFIMIISAILYDI